MGRQKSPEESPKKAGPAGAGAERRRHARVDVKSPGNGPFRLRADGAEQSFELMDLSESGVRIRSQSALGPMTRIHVAMMLPGARVGAASDVRFETTGVVVWSHRQSPTSFDTGVFFPELDDRQRAFLRTFVASHA
jgi:hypothetical protein